MVVVSRIGDCDDGGVSLGRIVVIIELCSFRSFGFFAGARTESVLTTVRSRKIYNSRSGSSNNGETAVLCGTRKSAQHYPTTVVHCRANLQHAPIF